MTQNSIWWETDGSLGDGVGGYAASEVRLEHQAAHGQFGVSYEPRDASRFPIVPAGNGNSVSIGVGYAWFNGYFYSNTTPLTLSVLPRNNHVVVLRIDNTAKTVRLAINSSNGNAGVGSNERALWGFSRASGGTGAIINLEDLRDYGKQSHLGLPMPSVETSTGSHNIGVERIGGTSRFAGSALSTFTLPNIPNNRVGYDITIVNVGTATLTIQGQSGHTVDGGANFKLPSGNSVTLRIAGATAWDLVGSTLGKGAGGGLPENAPTGDGKYELQIASGAATWVDATVGEKGEQGEQGPRGEQGIQGIQGPAGQQGPAGNDGATGPRGPAGSQGPAGDRGTDGTDGAPGAKGEKGDPGPQGPAGEDGNDGAPGEQGLRGLQGLQGPAGSDGSPGAKGDQGPQGLFIIRQYINATSAPTSAPSGGSYNLGTKELTASTGYTKTASNPTTGQKTYISVAEIDPATQTGTVTPNWSVPVEAGGTGPAGPQGPRGEKGEAGTAGATGPRGPQGIEGPQGPVGPVGPQGDRGPQGADGNDGAPGAAGANGKDGARGPAGEQGPAGAAGEQGDRGPAGPQGPAGNDGAQGPAGPQGPAGNDGARGATGPAGPQGPAGTTGPQGLQGIQGPVGPAGPAGPQGPAGDDGTADLSYSIFPIATGTVVANVGATPVELTFNAPESTKTRGSGIERATGNQALTLEAGTYNIFVKPNVDRTDVGAFGHNRANFRIVIRDVTNSTDLDDQTAVGYLRGGEPTNTVEGALSQHTIHLSATTNIAVRIAEGTQDSGNPVYTTVAGGRVTVQRIATVTTVEVEGGGDTVKLATGSPGYGLTLTGPDGGEKRLGLNLKLRNQSGLELATNFPNGWQIGLEGESFTSAYKTQLDNLTAAGVEYPQYIGASGVGGSGNAITLTASPALPSYKAGIGFIFITEAANTGNVTVNVSGRGAINLYDMDGTTALPAGRLPNDRIVHIIHDGTNFRLVSVSGPIGKAQVTPDIVRTYSSTTANTIRVLTQAEFDAITTKDSKVIYIIPTA